MAVHTFRDGKWYDKATGEEVFPASRAESWKSGGSLHIIPDIAEYRCPVTGKAISGRAEHRENLKRTGCRIIERGEARAQRREQASRLEEGISRSAREAIARIANNIEI